MMSKALKVIGAILVIVVSCMMLQGCVTETVEIPPIQIDAYSCVNGWRYHLDGSAVVDDAGGQLTCTSR